jgi:hypothetical protein
VSGNTVSRNAYAGVTVHSLVAGQDLNGNVVSGANSIDTNNVKGDAAGPVADRQTTGVLVRSVDRLSIKVTGNNISNDHFGIWTAGPVTVTGATANTFIAVAVRLSVN